MGKRAISLEESEESDMGAETHLGYDGEERKRVVCEAS